MIFTGTNFVSGASCSFGSGITVNSCVFNSGTQLTANITIAAAATVGARTVTVTNPDGQNASLSNSFNVTQRPPPPNISTVNPNSAVQSQSLTVIISGANFQNGATCSFGAGITVNSCAFGSSSQLTASIVVSATATVGTRTVTVTNPDGQSASVVNGFTVNQAPPPPPPTLSNISPASGQQTQTLNVTLTGTNFLGGATCNFGAGITVNSCALNSSSNITITASATTGTRSVTVTNPDGQSATMPSP